MRHLPGLVAAMCCIVFITTTSALTHEGKRLQASEKETIIAGIDTATKVLDALSKFTEISKEIPFEKMASCLGAFGGFISVLLIFLPKDDSAELTYMKKQFAKVDQKLDIITSKIDDMQSLIKLSTQKAQYIKEEQNILNGHRQLNAYMDKILNTNCSNKDDCTRKRHYIGHEYLNYFNIKKSMHMIFAGTYKTTAFGEPLFGLLVQHIKGDVMKLSQFAHRIINIGFKAQQAVLLYEKLSGSSTSIIESMSEWLKGIYKVREEKYKYEEAIYKSIDVYMSADVKDQKYQGHMSSNSQAAKTMRNDLRKKYFWLDWVVIAYKHNKESIHGYETLSGAFYNSPEDTNKRKRVVIAAVLPKGSYHVIRKEFARVILRRTMWNRFIVAGHSHEKIFKMLKYVLNRDGLWRRLRTFIVVGVNDEKALDVQVAQNDWHTGNYFDETLYFEKCNWISGKLKCAISNRIRVIAVFKSTEEIFYHSCRGPCAHGHGRCIRKPYTVTHICACKPFYEGPNCSHRIKIDVAMNIKKLFATAMKIPNMVDVYYGIKDMGDKLGASLGNIHKAITSLEIAVQVSFDKVGMLINDKFKWAKLITIYSRSIELLKHTVRRFRELPEGSAAIKQLAETALNPYHISFWISKIKTLIEGRNDEMHQHKPIMHMVMDKYKHLACSDSYKSTLRNVWQQINILQLQGYLAWIKALQVLNKPTDSVLREYKRVVASEKRTFRTCKMNIPGSVNGNCNGEVNLYPGMTIDLKCQPNTILKGSKTPSCEKPSQCIPCNCNVEGSVSLQCNANGACSCKPKFYGQKCSNRDCKWAPWSSWGSQCSKTCDYRGKVGRKRNFEVVRRGNGRKCSDKSSQTKICFTESCANVCKVQYTQIHRLSVRNIGDYGRFRVHCPGNEWLKGFQLEKKNTRHLKVKMECCNTNTNGICIKKVIQTYDTYCEDSVRCLTHQYVKCPKASIMMGYQFIHGGGQFSDAHFKLNCCQFHSRFHTYLKCYNVRNSKSQIQLLGIRDILDQRVSCKDGYFLNFFRLRYRGGFQYVYTCCQMLP